MMVLLIFAVLGGVEGGGSSEYLQSVLDSVTPAGKDLSIFLPALSIRSNASLSENAWKRD